MPKLTRDQQFQKSFEGFFDKYAEKYCPDLHEYLLVNNTTNKNRWDQKYVLTIPGKIVDYHIDTFIADENGNITPPGPVMKPQELPNIDEFMDKFDKFYRKHYLVINTKVMSAVQFSSATILDEDLIININTFYHKNHLPFPTPLSEKERKLQQKCDNLEERITSLTDNIKAVIELNSEKQNQYDNLRRIMRTERKNTENKYKAMMEKMQSKLSEFYGKSNSPEDCPVCYDAISAEKYRLPGCCHSICTDCSSRCSKCPICRDNY